MVIPGLAFMAKTNTTEINSNRGSSHGNMLKAYQLHALCHFHFQEKDSRYQNSSKLVLCSYKKICQLIYFSFRHCSWIKKLDINFNMWELLIFFSKFCCYIANCFEFKCINMMTRFIFSYPGRRHLVFGAIWLGDIVLIKQCFLEMLNSYLISRTICVIQWHKDGRGDLTV